MNTLFQLAILTSCDITDSYKQMVQGNLTLMASQYELVKQPLVAAVVCTTLYTEDIRVHTDVPLSVTRYKQTWQLQLLLGHRICLVIIYTVNTITW